MSENNCLKSRTLFPIEIQFDEASHTYTKDGNTYLSASQLIKEFTEPFDPDGSILKRCAEKEGIPETELKARWEGIGEEARNNGTDVHKELENYILSSKIEDTPNRDIVESFAKIKFEGKLFTEHRLWLDKYLVAGTTDLVELLPNNKINVYDFKTNKSIPQYTKWAKRMYYPLSSYFDTSFWKYTVQMSIYGFILEEFGYWVNKLELFWINPKKRQIEPMPVTYIRRDVANLLSAYQAQKIEIPAENP